MTALSINPVTVIGGVVSGSQLFTANLASTGDFIQSVSLGLGVVNADDRGHYRIEIRPGLYDMSLGRAPGQVSGGVLEELMSHSERDIPLGDDCKTTDGQAMLWERIQGAAERAQDTMTLVMQTRLAALAR